jgi:protein-L-isoaspartate(D-aspartate) O-methyltransferase
MFYKEWREDLVKTLISKGFLYSSKVIRSFRIVPREKFLPIHLKEKAYIDTPLPIGFEQTISAPHMVAIMAEASDLQEGNKILEIGTGSGYHAAITAEIVCQKNYQNLGHVYTLEIIPELFSFAKKNLEETNYTNRVTIISQDGSIGYSEQAPYDRILVTAAAPKIPTVLIEQLKLGGILLIPVGDHYFFQSLIKIRKNFDGRTVTEKLGRVAFVPLTGKNGWKS